MPRKCIVKSCTHSTSRKCKGFVENIMFHSFPANVIRREKWILNIQLSANQAGPIRHGALICSDHFTIDSYITKLDGSKVLKDIAEPTEFNHEDNRFSYIELIRAENVDKKNVDLNVTSSGIDVPSPTFTTTSKESSKSSLKNHQERCSIGLGLNAKIDLKVIDEASPDFGIIAGDSQNHRDIDIDEEFVDFITGDSRDHQERSSTDFGGYSANVDLTDGNESTPTFTDNIQSNSTSMQCWERPAKFQLNRIRYPGDITDVQTMSRRQLEASLVMCKKKVKAQAVSIKALQRAVLAKDRQLLSLRSTVKELKKKFALSEHATESIEVNMTQVSNCDFLFVNCQ